MNENLLHFIWKQKLLLNKSLYCTDLEEVTILKPGTLNFDSGPDFFNARVMIGSMILAGNIEIHLKSSDWIRHNHNNDQAYNSVILHVVFEHDKDVPELVNAGVKTIEVKKFLPSGLIQKYNALCQTKEWIPCESTILWPKQIVMKAFMERLVIERLEKKLKNIESTFRASGSNWEHTFYIILARYFGQKTNSDIFENLAQRIPILILAKNKNSEATIQALLLGVAGFLDQKTEDNYIEFLRTEYTHLKNKYKINQIEKASWKFAKTRPANFPTVRIMQFAALIYRSSHLFSKIIETKCVDELKNLLKINSDQNIDFGKLSGHHFNKKTFSSGESFVRHLIINAIAPILFFYGKAKDDIDFKERAVELLYSLNSEKNSVINKWVSLGLISENALHSQSLLHLKFEYCNKFKCLDCVIGNEILTN